MSFNFNKKLNVQLLPLLLFVIYFYAFIYQLIGVHPIQNALYGSLTIDLGTSFSFLLLSIVLYHKNLNHRQSIKFISYLCGLVFLVSMSLLFRKAFHLKLDMGDLIQTASLSFYFSSQMPVITAFCFCLTSMAFLGSYVPEKLFLRLSQMLFMVVLLLATIALTMNSLRYTLSGPFSVFQEMSLPTALSLIVVVYAANATSIKHEITECQKLGTLNTKISSWVMAVFINACLFITLVLVLSHMANFREFGTLTFVGGLIIIGLSFISRPHRFLGIGRPEKDLYNNFMFSPEEYLSQLLTPQGEEYKTALFDAFGHIIGSNFEYRDMFSYHHKGAQDHQPSIFNQSFYESIVNMPSQKQLENAHIWTSMITKKNHQGDLQCMHMVLIPLKSSTGGNCRYIGVFMDCMPQESYMVSIHQDSTVEERERVEFATKDSVSNLNTRLHQMIEKNRVMAKQINTFEKKSWSRASNFLIRHDLSMSNLTKSFLSLPSKLIHDPLSRSENENVLLKDKGQSFHD